MITALQPYTVITSGGLFADTQQHQSVFNAAEESRFRKMELTFNNLLISRREMISRFMDRRRNIDEECGYPLPWTSHKQMQPQDWQDLHDYDPVCATINSLMARECFQVNFEAYEDEDPDTYTEFEEAVDNLGRGMTDEPSHYGGDTLCIIADLLKRAWESACIGRHACILFGFDDVMPGDPDGLTRPVKLSKYPNRRLLYARVLPETMCTVSEKETNIASPRYGKPLYYSVTLGDPNEHTYYPITTPGTATYNKKVHFSRIQHITKGDGLDPYYHKPECQDIIKPICNLQKVFGADSEGRWKGGFSTISIESANPDITPDKEQLKTLVQDWERSLTRMWTLDGGLSAKTITPTIADPTPAVEMNLKLIAMRKRIPKRKLEGSERGELSSAQDDGDWNDQVKGYQHNVLNPRLVIPFLDRLINVGVLPVPKGSKPEEIFKGKGGNNTTSSKITKVEFGEPFRTRPGQIVSPVVANAFPPKNGNTDSLSQQPNATDKPSNGKPANGQSGAAQPPASDSLLSPRKKPEKRPGYYIYWPDIASQTDDQKADIATKVITALATYAEKQVDQIIPVRECLVGLFRGLFTEDEVDAWLDAADTAREEQQTLQHQKTQVEMETQQSKIDAGLEMSPEQEAEQRAKEMEAKIAAQSKSKSPAGGNT